MVGENEYIREGDETMATEKELRMRLAHIGMNAQNDQKARQVLMRKSQDLSSI